MSEDDSNGSPAIEDDALHVWIISTVLFVVYVANGLCALVFILWRRNRQPIKVRSAFIHITLVVGELLGCIVLLLRIVIGRKRFPCFLYVGGAYLLMPVALTPRVFRIWRVYVIFKLNKLKNKALMVQWRHQMGGNRQQNNPLLNVVNSANHVSHGSKKKEKGKKKEKEEREASVDVGVSENNVEIAVATTATTTAATAAAVVTDGMVLTHESGSGDGTGDKSDGMDNNNNGSSGGGGGGGDGGGDGDGGVHDVSGEKPAVQEESMSSYQPMFADLNGVDDDEDNDDDDDDDDDDDVSTYATATFTFRHHLPNISSKIDTALLTLSSRRKFVLALKLSAHIGTMFAIIGILQMLSFAYIVIMALSKSGNLSKFLTLDGCQAGIEYLALISILVVCHGFLMIILAFLCRRIRESYGLAREGIASTIFLVGMVVIYTAITVLDVFLGNVDTKIFSATWILAIMILVDSWIIRWIPIINTFRRRFNTSISAIVDSDQTSHSTLFSILDNKFTSKYFYMYAETEFSSENISFYDDVKFYKSLLDKIDYREKIKRYIIVTYFQKGSPLELNIPHEIRSLYIEKLHNSQQLDMGQQQAISTIKRLHVTSKDGPEADFFALAMRHVELNMLDTLSRFQTSELYQSMVKQQSEFQSDLKNFNMY